MPRFYFHLSNDLDVPDEEGAELPDLDAAIQRAREQARFTLAETIKDEGRGNLAHRIDIEDENCDVLDTVWFRDVVKIESADPNLS